MATDYASTGFSRSSSMSAARSPDTASPVFPERAIRPMPKNRLQSRLSPEQASKILYPPDPPPISPTLSFAPVQDGGNVTQQPRLMNGVAHSHHHDHDHEHHVVHQHHCTCGGSADSGDEEIEFDHPHYRYPPGPAVNGVPVKPMDTVHRRLVEASRASAKPPPPGSTASSGDGYESFENTSNKKKRKIPLSGTTSMHQSQLSAEMASMGIGGHQVEDEYAVSGAASTHQQMAASAASGTGISGAGRGRYGRQDAKHRRPLGSSTMNTINGYSGRTPSRNGAGKFSHRHTPFIVRYTGIENTGGIISQAIKTAAEQGPLTPAGKGRENGSLLQSAASANASADTTPKTQFTFSCESESANKMLDQQSAAAAAYAAGTPTPTRTGPPASKPPGPQTTPSHRGNPQANHGRPPPPPNGVPPSGHPPQAAAPPPKPKQRRNPNREYALQAANRKKQQQYQNYHHRPKSDDTWICEFCEYEDIYGEPPYAMIRRYEIKDRLERKKAAEKKRLLEKAKMKGRKNKKGSGKGGKNAHANNTAAPAAPPANQQNYDPNLPPPDGEDYYDEEEDYGDEYEPVGPDDHYPPQDCYPPPVPYGNPAAGGGGRA